MWIQNVGKVDIIKKEGRGSILAKVDNGWQWGGGVSNLPKIGWRNLWTLPYTGHLFY